MATGKASDFKIYNDQFYSGLVEEAVQQTNVLGSVGIRVSQRAIRGDYDYKSLIKKLSGAVSRRDTTSTSAATGIAVTMDEQVSVKLNRKIGPIEQTLDAWRKAALPFGDAAQGDNGAEAFSRYLGKMLAKDVSIEMLDTALLAARVAVEQAATNKFTISANGTMNTPSLISTLAKMGDASSRIKAWVMHSKVWFDLMQYQASSSSSGGELALFTVQAGNPLTLNRPVFVTDSASLVVTGSPDLYHTFGLVDDAIVLENSEEQEMAFTLVTGLENLVHRMQGEFAYNLSLQGYKWDVANGGANPNSTAVGTATNWDQWATSYKDLLGVACISG
jgi:hypothetical protein